MRRIIHGRTFGRSIRPAVIAALILFGASAAGAKSSAPLADPVSLNIGLSCQWQQRCMSQQKKAMKRALKFVKKKQLPAWRIQACNRNASKSRSRVDWVGFNNCVRNADIRPIPPRPARKRSTRLIQASPPARSRGERG